MKELATLFFRLGFTAFGGPAVHIAMMQEEVVTKRKWMTHDHFLDLVGATNLIPGPNSTELAIHIGHERAGWRGLLLAGVCFIFPAVVLTACLAWLYKRYGTLPDLQPYLYGIKPAIIAVVLSAVFPLAKRSFKSVELAIAGLVVLVLSLAGCNEIYLMFGTGLTYLAWKRVGPGRGKGSLFPLTLLKLPSTVLVSASNAQLFWIFLKIGAVLYGSGYVLFAFLDTELVATGLLSRQQLIDAIAVGQFTPGPVFSAVTFIGYQIGDWSGAMVATLGVFLPSFIFVAMLNPLVRRLRNSVGFSAFLDAVNVASVAIIVAVCFDMAKASVNDWRTILIAFAGLLLTFRYPRINSAWIVLGGAAAGFLLYLI